MTAIPYQMESKMAALDGVYPKQPSPERTARIATACAQSDAWLAQLHQACIDGTASRIRASDCDAPDHLVNEVCPDCGARTSFQDAA